VHTNRQLVCASNFVKSDTSVSTLYVSFFHFFSTLLVNIFLGYKEHCLLLYHNQFVFLCKDCSLSFCIINMTALSKLLWSLMKDFECSMSFKLQNIHIGNLFYNSSNSKIYIIVR